jgi:hypothetical protein
MCSERTSTVHTKAACFQTTSTPWKQRFRHSLLSRQGRFSSTPFGLGYTESSSNRLSYSRPGFETLNRRSGLLGLCSGESSESGLSNDFIRCMLRGPCGLDCASSPRLGEAPAIVLGPSESLLLWTSSVGADAGLCARASSSRCLTSSFCSRSWYEKVSGSGSQTGSKIKRRLQKGCGDLHKGLQLAHSTFCSRSRCVKIRKHMYAYKEGTGHLKSGTAVCNRGFLRESLELALSFQLEVPVWQQFEDGSPYNQARRCRQKETRLQKVVNCLPSARDP